MFIATIAYGQMRTILDNMHEDYKHYEWADEPTAENPLDIVHVVAHDWRVVSLFEDCSNPTAPIGWVTYPSLNEVGGRHHTGMGEIPADDLTQFLKDWAAA